MASDTRLKIIIDAENKANSAFASLQKQLDVTQVSVDGVSDAMKSVGKVGVTAFAGLATFLGISTQEAKNAESAQFRLAQILRTTGGATDDQIDSLKKQADALERVGVVSGEAITQAQAQLATFDLQATTIEKLTPAILDYVVAEKGAAASTEDLKQLTNGLAQALNGNFGSLTRVGFVLDDVTKELISNGTEAERAAALVKVLNSTYEGFNEAARETADGSMVAMRNEFGKLQEVIGQQILPIVRDLTESITPMLIQFSSWAEANPTLTRNLIITTLALTAVLAVMLPIGIALPGIVMGFSALGGAVTAFAMALGVASVPAWGVLALIGLLTTAIVQIGRVVLLLATDWENIWHGIELTAAEASNAVIDTVESMVNFIISGVNKAIDAINRVIKLAQKVPGLGDKLTTIKSIQKVDFETIDTDAMTNQFIAKPTAQTSNPITVNVTGNSFIDAYSAEIIGDLMMQRLKASNAI
ncbi:hypothetical protein E3V39_12470 [Gammaproteobacteria bacterium LSUCC0112]|nr:hypothetical protein E3V39_12470 [Gammaproteobacteria bacterium LSUCC0112]